MSDRRSPDCSRAPRPGPRRRLAGLAAAAALATSLALAAAGCGSTAPTSVPSTGRPATTAAATVAATSPSAQPSPSVAPVTWSDCGNGFQCGTVDVPLDYAKPTGAIVRLALVRLPAADPGRRIGSLLVNPGGPGISGVRFVRDSATTLFSADLRARFDIVGFDPRGVGDSTPIRCVDNLDHFTPEDARADTPTELQDLLTGARAFADGCERRNPDLLPNLSTADVARDLDQVRAALGDAKLTYVGFSYGTLIGATYASLFPTHIRAMVLDGAIDPALGEAALREGQARGFETELDRFLAACAADASCAFHSGGRPGPAFDALMERIDQHPLPTLRLENREPAGPTQAWLAVTGGLYSPLTWPALATALAEAQAGDGTDLLLMSDPYRGRQPNGGYSNLVDAYAAITCLDWPSPRDPAAYATMAATFTRVAPRFGRLLAYNDIDCAYWAVPPERSPGPLASPGAPPIVVVGSAGDPATPYPWAVALARELGSGILVTRQGDGHTGYPYSPCVRGAADAYLLDLTTPSPGLTCQ